MMKDQTDQVINSVEGFIKGGDNSDIQLLEGELHKSFQNVQNGYFGEKGIFIINKQQYLKLVGDKTFGGIPRSMDILSVDVYGGIAMVKAELKSEKLTFTSFISLVLDKEDNWKVIGNFPHVVSN